MRVRIVGPEPQILDEVATWWYEESSLIVEYVNGKRDTFRRSNVIERLLPDDI